MSFLFLVIWVCHFQLILLVQQVATFSIIPKSTITTTRKVALTSLQREDNNGIVIYETTTAGGSSSTVATTNTDRREFFQTIVGSGSIAATTLSTFTSLPAYAKLTGPNDGNLPDLPPEAVRSYLQYRIPLQTSADFYIFEVRDKLQDPSTWGEINELFQVNNNRGQGNPSRIEREFTNVFRILGLSMPPEYADEMRDAQFKFEAAASKISKVTAGIRRDLPIELDPNISTKALDGWEDGRIAINEFFTILNDATGLNEMKLLPANTDEYVRSKKRFVELKKKIKLCQNRGGPTLANTWGQLMVSGYMQDSCGIPDLDDYFYQ